MENLATYAQLGGTVVTVVLFLNYLTKRDNKWTDSLKNSSDANVVLARALQRLTDKIETNSSVNIKNISKVKENVQAIKENVQAVKENTESIEKNTEVVSSE